ncbi:hypothetical protein A2Z33_04250 [Candidatus Gottesmanbacteria bacterium RBG_16_52_11]|uniref:Uncharacterized protein n=1 Tax=Candidatus Gottesmanbacteria bacterium RBG_16_52_11 TaxID=1798374 RepID=A0A1F5YVV5_9BACT|nr:MAG: hypothetical protein A2Z33_04250 [Candidatus Gottesmanbacteria bacterium RBG_16_52_11]
MPKVIIALDRIIRGLTVGLFAVIPLFFLPLTRDFFDTNKWLLTCVAAVVILLIWSVRTVLARDITFSPSPAAAGTGLLTLVLFLSFLIASRNRVEAAMVPTGFVTFAALTLVIFFGGAFVNRGAQTLLKWMLFVTSTILAVIAVYLFFGIGKLMFPNVSYLADSLWTPAGNSIAAMSVMLLTLPLLVEETVSAYRKKADMNMTFASVMTLVVIFGSVLTLVQVVPRISTNLLPLSTAWAVLLEMFKTPVGLLFGVGAENFLAAFSAGRPSAYNALPVWNIRFTVSSSMLLHLATTAGLVGTAGLFVFGRNLITGWKTGHWGLRVSFILALLLILLTPPNITVLVAIVALMLLKPHHTEAVKTISVPDQARQALFGGIGLAILIFGLSAFGLYKVYAAEHFFYRSLLAAQANNGTDTYNLQNRTVNTNPYVTQYHITFAQTNLALANGIASSVGQNDKQTLTEEERQLVSRLIQQSINEGKLAINLSPGNILAWETLAGVYQNIAGVVTGADDWAIIAYQQAVRLDPVNPILRLNLAGSYIVKQDFPSALQQLQLAAALKPDLANIHYNLAFVYRQMKDPLREAAALQTALALLPAGSADADRVTKELEDAKAKLSAEEIAVLEGQKAADSGVQSPLSTPATRPEPQITPKIDLGQEASPQAQAQPPLPPEPTITPTRAPSPAATSATPSAGTTQVPPEGEGP